MAAPFVFSSTPETVFGLYLVYFFRVFERHIGSNKYSVRLFESFFSAQSVSTLVPAAGEAKDLKYLCVSGISLDLHCTDNIIGAGCFGGNPR